MQLVDSHCHLDMLDLTPYDGDMGQLLAAAEAVGVEHFLTIGVDMENADKVIAIAEQFDNVHASVGMHPSDKAESEPTVEDLLAYAARPKVVAIGETGLDYYYNDSGLELQRERFRTHIRAAKQCQKPLIIHSRDAREDTIRILTEEGANQVTGVMHCFTENWAMAEQALALGFYISISGIVTFKNAQNVADVAKKIPLERLLIETDSPYLAPVPYRGKKNEPQYVRFVAEKVAELREVPVEEIAAATTCNFYRLFGI